MSSADPYGYSALGTSNGHGPNGDTDGSYAALEPHTKADHLYYEVSNEDRGVVGPAAAPAVGADPQDANSYMQWQDVETNA